MNVTAFRSPLVKVNDNLEDILLHTLPNQLEEESIVVVTSKIISFCEGRLVEKTSDEKSEKHRLVEQEADYFIDPHSSKYNLMLTIKNNWMFVNAGIDESNAENHFILWPKNPQASAEKIWQFLRQQYGLKRVGVTISDSTSIPLNWGVVGHSIAYCGFYPLKSYIGKPDLFGRELKMEQVNIAQSVTAAAVLEMGEGNEQTPVGLVENVKNVEWQDRSPTADELSYLHIEIDDDAYAPILQNAPWQPGKSGK